MHNRYKEFLIIAAVIFVCFPAMAANDESAQALLRETLANQRNATCIKKTKIEGASLVETYVFPDIGSPFSLIRIDRTNLSENASQPNRATDSSLIVTPDRIVNLVPAVNRAVAFPNPAPKKEYDPVSDLDVFSSEYCETTSVETMHDGRAFLLVSVDFNETGRQAIESASISPELLAAGIVGKLRESPPQGFPLGIDFLIDPSSKTLYYTYVRMRPEQEFAIDRLDNDVEYLANAKADRIGSLPEGCELAEYDDPAAATLALAMIKRELVAGR